MSSSGMGGGMKNSRVKPTFCDDLEGCRHCYAAKSIILDGTCSIKGFPQLG
jgi:hypothetical protein